MGDLTNHDIVTIITVSCATVFLSIAVCVLAIYRCCMFDMRRKQATITARAIEEASAQDRRVPLLMSTDGRESNVNNALSQTVLGTGAVMGDLGGRPPAEWSVLDASNWIAMNSEKGAETAKLAKEHRIDGKALLLLTQADMERSLKLKAVGDRLRFQNALTHLREIHQQGGCSTLTDSAGPSSSSSYQHSPPAYK
ncbi:hypothetical protein BJ741DRAFT_668960 [Chytriomyces cf. hyalinus JEL632]|nr:hypothetical protein BJ741DRAFT_668960 [Chytriomyces cf. hyalinus JEL632]